MLEQILDALESGRLACPFSEVDLIDAGCHGPPTEVVGALATVDTASAIRSVRLVIAERVYRPRLDSTWFGQGQRLGRAWRGPRASSCTGCSSPRSDP